MHSTFILLLSYLNLTFILLQPYMIIGQPCTNPFNVFYLHLTSILLVSNLYRTWISPILGHHQIIGFYLNLTSILLVSNLHLRITCLPIGIFLSSYLGLPFILPWHFLWTNLLEICISVGLSDILFSCKMSLSKSCFYPLSCWYLIFFYICYKVIQCPPLSTKPRFLTSAENF